MPGADSIAASTTSRGKWTRPPDVERQPVIDQPPAHLRTADLHADLGQDAHRLVDDPRDESSSRMFRVGRISAPLSRIATLSLQRKPSRARPDGLAWVLVPRDAPAASETACAIETYPVESDPGAQVADRCSHPQRGPAMRTRLQMIAAVAVTAVAWLRAAAQVHPRHRRHRPRWPCRGASVAASEARRPPRPKRRRRRRNRRRSQGRRLDRDRPRRRIQRDDGLTPSR